jgi:hypothetical protein
MASFADAAVAVGTSIGRYFSIVSMLPSALLVGWSALLLAGEAFTGQFTPVTAWQSAASVSLGSIGVFVTVALAVSLILNPFQFAATQLLEGYWGGGQVGSAIGAARTNYHRRRFRELIKRKSRASKRLDESATEQGETPQGLLLSAAGDEVVHLQIRADAMSAAASRYPEAARILPTRLGNALRSSEDTAGREYGLDALRVAGHLSLLSETPSNAYVRDTRESLDLSVRLCMVFALATPISCVLLVREGWWMLLALVPYGAAYLSYRGAVLAALAYGNAVRFQIDLDRFALYEALHVFEPASTDREREQNADLMSLLSREPTSAAGTSIRYRSSRPSAPTGRKRASRTGR